MDQSLAERIAVVETKVSTLQTGQDSMSAKVDEIYNHVVAERANRKLAARVFAVILGFFTAADALVRIFRH